MTEYELRVLCEVRDVLSNVRHHVGKGVAWEWVQDQMCVHCLDSALAEVNALIPDGFNPYD